MSIIEDYLEQAGATYITGKTVNKKHEYPIDKLVVDTESFGKTYMNVISRDEKDEEVTIRLGVKNVRRIIEELGTESEGWLGNALVALATETYVIDGKAQVGIIWGGKKK